MFCILKDQVNKELKNTCEVESGWTEEQKQRQVKLRIRCKDTHKSVWESRRKGEICLQQHNHVH